MTFVAFKFWLKKIFLYIKHYWYIPIVILTLVIGFVFFSRKSSSSLIDIITNTIKSHQKEIDILETNHQKEIEKKEKNLEVYFDKVEQINKKFEEENIKLSNKQQKQIEKIVKENKDDTTKLAEKLSKVTGFKVEIIDDKE